MTCYRIHHCRFDEMNVLVASVDGPDTGNRVGALAQNLQIPH